MLAIEGARKTGSWFANLNWKKIILILLGIWAILYIWRKWLKPMFTGINNVVNTFAAGKVPPGYSITEADAFIESIVDFLALDASWYEPEYSTNDNEPAVVILFEESTGEINRYIERRWQVIRSKSMLSELKKQMSPTEYKKVVTAIKKTP